MKDEMSYKDRLMLLKEWMGEIIDGVKKDLRNEHLKKDYSFAKKYFPGKNINKVESQELASAYLKALQEEEAGEAIAEFIIQHWILRNSELYHFFEENLSKVNPDFTEIKELTPEQAKTIEQAAFHEFGARRTYIFSLLNGVAFSPEHMKKMAEAASKEKIESVKTMQEDNEKRSLEELKSQHALEVSRLTDKYEKKLIGFQKKYAQDTEMLKKQLANLQRKLAGV